MSTPESKVSADIATVKAWYASHLFWSGAIVGAVIALVVRHFV